MSMVRDWLDAQLRVSVEDFAAVYRTTDAAELAKLAEGQRALVELAPVCRLVGDCCPLVNTLGEDQRARRRRRPTRGLAELWFRRGALYRYLGMEGD